MRVCIVCGFKAGMVCIFHPEVAYCYRCYSNIIEFEWTEHLYKDINDFTELFNHQLQILEKEKEKTLLYSKMLVETITVITKDHYDSIQKDIESLKNAVISNGMISNLKELLNYRINDYKFLEVCQKFGLIINQEALTSDNKLIQILTNFQDLDEKLKEERKNIEKRANNLKKSCAIDFDKYCKADSQIETISEHSLKITYNNPSNISSHTCLNCSKIIKDSETCCEDCKKLYFSANEKNISDKKTQDSDSKNNLKLPETSLLRPISPKPRERRNNEGEVKANNEAINLNNWVCQYCFRSNKIDSNRCGKCHRIKEGIDINITKRPVSPMVFENKKSEVKCNKCSKLINSVLCPKCRKRADFDSKCNCSQDISTINTCYDCDTKPGRKSLIPEIELKNCSHCNQVNIASVRKCQHCGNDIQN